jgi:hypothetical protein
MPLTPCIAYHGVSSKPQVQSMAIRLSDTAEATSDDTLAALAQVIRVLAPEVCSVSFHDFAADTL